jgi:hypothetical protein
VHCHSSISKFSHPQYTNLLACMTSLPCVKKTIAGSHVLEVVSILYHIALSVFMEFKIRFLGGNYF